MNPEKSADIIEGSIADIVQKFNKGTLATETNVFRGVLKLAKDLDLDAEGKIKTTGANLRKLNKIRALVEPIVLNDAYKKRVSEYIGGFDDVEKLQGAYLESIDKAFDPSKVLYNQIVDYEKDITINSLMDAGISENVIAPIEGILNTNVTTGGHFDDLVDQLRENIKGIPGPDGKLGSLSRYSQQITRDSLNQFSRNYHDSVTKDLGKEWYYYSPGRKRTSRSYCIKRNGRYYHKIEVEQSSHLKWSGKIPGTNESTIIKYAGGYNCIHQYYAVNEEIVPDADVDRNILNENHKTSVDRGADAIIRGSHNYGPTLDKKARAIAKKNNSDITPINYKKKDSMIRKINDEEGGKYMNIKDGVRNTIIAHSKDINKVIKDVEKDFKVNRVKRQKFDNGYSGNIINVETNQPGLIGEIQVNTPAMIYAKEEHAKAILGNKVYGQIKKRTGQPHGLGHGYYEEIRELKGKKNKMTAKDKARVKELDKKSAEYYNQFKFDLDDPIRKSVKKAPPKPKESEFVPAKTREEAEKWATDNAISKSSKKYIEFHNESAKKWLEKIRKTQPDYPEKYANFKKAVSYRGLTTESANEINETLHFLLNKKNMPKLATIESKSIRKAGWSAQQSTGGDLQINSIYNKSPKIRDEHHKKSVEAISKFEKALPDLKKMDKAGKLDRRMSRNLRATEDMLTYKRQNVSTTIGGTITHEMGHHFDNNMIKILTKKGMTEIEIKALVKKGMEEAQAMKHNISYYAFSNVFKMRPEIYAESFALYIKGETKDVPPSLKIIFDKLTK